MYSNTFDARTGISSQTPYIPSSNDNAPTAIIVPATISPFQARAALLQAGLLEDAEESILQAGPADQIAWEYATEWRRDSPTIAAMASTLGLSGEDVDNLFIQASKITA